MEQNTASNQPGAIPAPGDHPATKITTPPPFPTRTAVVEIWDLVGVGILESLAQGGHIRIRPVEEEKAEEEPGEDLPKCPVCEASTTELQTEPTLEQDVCLLCHRAAARILNKYRGALEKHDREFHDQLPQMVRDVRSGAEEPTFYRGFE